MRGNVMALPDTIPELKRKIAVLVSRHTRNMQRKNYWYDKKLMEADKTICVKASDLRIRLTEMQAAQKEN